jgi:hypothetical protein
VEDQALETNRVPVIDPVLAGVRVLGTSPVPVPVPVPVQVQEKDQEAQSVQALEEDQALERALVLEKNQALDARVPEQADQHPHNLVQINEVEVESDLQVHKAAQDPERGRTEVAHLQVLGHLKEVVAEAGLVQEGQVENQVLTGQDQVQINNRAPEARALVLFLEATGPNPRATGPNHALVLEGVLLVNLSPLEKAKALSPQDPKAQEVLRVLVSQNLLAHQTHAPALNRQKSLRNMKVNLRESPKSDLERKRKKMRMNTQDPIRKRKRKKFLV